MMFILSFDMSTRSTGYAIFGDGMLVESGLIRSKKKVPVERINEIYSFCKELFNKHNYDYVFIEDVPLSSSVNRRVAENLLLLQGCILSLCFEYNIKFVQIEPLSWRKIVGITCKNKREEQKKSAIYLVNERFGFNFDWVDSKYDEKSGFSDISEAILIGLAGIKKYIEGEVV